MSRVDTPSIFALSRLIVIRASGFENLRFTSAICNTSLSYTFSINRGNTSSSRSMVIACNTYCTGIPPRRLPNVVCCCTKARALVCFFTTAESSSAISICERSRVEMSCNATWTLPRPLLTRAVTYFDSGTSESICRLMFSV